MNARARSPRAGWHLVELVDGRWSLRTTGDREALKADHARLVSEIIARRDGLHHPGRCALLYDALGQLRDGFPAFPRLADGVTKLRVPKKLPADGELAEVRS